eukprot:6325691-Pyramimonas_sp.AAC.1
MRACFRGTHGLVQGHFEQPPGHLIAAAARAPLGGGGPPLAPFECAVCLVYCDCRASRLPRGLGKMAQIS